MKRPAGRIAPDPRAGNAVLIIDDDPGAVKLLSMYLGPAGYRVSHAGRGDEAVAVAGALGPAAIILDILLPAKSGWDVLAELKASPRTRGIPVIIVSVLDKQALGFRLGAFDYLVKPVERMQLLRAVGLAILRERLGRGIRKIMVVYEHPERWGALTPMLPMEQFEVIQALGYAEFWHLAPEVRPDMLIIDMVRHMSAIREIIQTIHDEPVTAGIPVMVVTHSPQSLDIHVGPECGALTLLVDESRVAPAIHEAVCLIGRGEPVSYCGGRFR